MHSYKRCQPDSENPKWNRAEIPIESVGHATNQLLALGMDVEVIAPGELRASVACVARELGVMYGRRSIEN